MMWDLVGAYFIIVGIILGTVLVCAGSFHAVVYIKETYF